jgi:Protein of unknown function (DUF559)
MRDAALIARALQQHGLLYRSDVGAAGVNDSLWYRLVGDGVWVPMVPGVFHHAATIVTTEMQIRAGSRWLGPRGRLFGDASLWWLGIDVDEPSRVSFQTKRESRHVPPWMDLHTTASLVPADTISRRGVPCSSAVRSVLDWATCMPSARMLERAIDDAHRRRLLAIPRLTSRFRETGGRGRPGTVLLRELLLDSGGESHLERRFLSLMRVSGLPRPDCQIIHRRGGKTVARVDFQFPHSKVVVEVSGRRGHSSDAERDADARRRNTLQGRGFVVIEFTTAHVIDDPAYVVATVRSQLALSSS